MAYTFTTINGCRVEVHVAAAFQRMAAAFLRETGCQLLVRDGTRTDEEQEREWDAYVRRGKAPPKVAFPGTSNHQENGPSGPRSLDLYDSGADPGVTVFGTDRDAWMQVNAGRFGFENEGNSFGEAWHKTYRGSLTDPLPTTPPPAAPILSEEDDMLALKINLPNGSHFATLAPGVFSGLIKNDDPNLIRNIVRSDDTWTEVNDGQLKVLLHKHGIALDCYRPAGADLEIRDAATGVWSRGGRWSASDAILGALGKALAR